MLQRLRSFVDGGDLGQRVVGIGDLGQHDVGDLRAGTADDDFQIVAPMRHDVTSWMRAPSRP